MSDFSSVPVLDYTLLAAADTRPQFLAQLRHALVNVGFLYLANHPVVQSDIDALVGYIPRLFALPTSAKESMRMANSEHFLGYSRFGAELTKGEVDQREQFDFATRHTSRWRAGDPDHYRLWGPSQVRSGRLFWDRALADGGDSGLTRSSSLGSARSWSATSTRSRLWVILFAV